MGGELALSLSLTKSSTDSNISSLYLCSCLSPHYSFAAEESVLFLLFPSHTLSLSLAFPLCALPSLLCSLPILLAFSVRFPHFHQTPCSFCLLILLPTFRRALQSLIKTNLSLLSHLSPLSLIYLYQLTK